MGLIRARVVPNHNGTGAKPASGGRNAPVRQTIRKTLTWTETKAWHREGIAKSCEERRQRLGVEACVYNRKWKQLWREVVATWVVEFEKARQLDPTLTKSAMQLTNDLEARLTKVVRATRAVLDSLDGRKAEINGAKLQTTALTRELEAAKRAGDWRPIQELKQKIKQISIPKMIYLPKMKKTIYMPKKSYLPSDPNKPTSDFFSEFNTELFHVVACLIAENPDEETVADKVKICRALGVNFNIDDPARDAQAADELREMWQLWKDDHLAFTTMQYRGDR